MALRDQPYFPLYVDDFLTDEKLNECSAVSHGVYIKLMCLMHKSEEYGKILLKQKDKQTDNQIKNFCLKLVRHFPFTIIEIEKAIEELIDEGVLYIDADSLCQKRMIKDNKISELRKNAGLLGGNPQVKKKGVLFNQKPNQMVKQMSKQNTVNVNVPEIEDVIAEFEFNNGTKKDAELFYHHYNSIGWVDTNDRKISNWKSRVVKWLLDGIKNNGKENRGRGAIDFDKYAAEREASKPRSSGVVTDTIPKQLQ